MFLRRNHFVFYNKCVLWTFWNYWFTDCKNLIIIFGIFPLTLVYIEHKLMTAVARVRICLFPIVSFQEKWSYTCCYHKRQRNNCLHPYNEWKTLSIFLYTFEYCLNCTLYTVHVCICMFSYSIKPDGNIVSRQHHH